MTDHEIFKKLVELKKQKIDVVLASIVETAGSTPREVGAKMIICGDGTSYGTIGGGCGESEVRSAALRCLLTGQKPELLEVSLLDELGTRGGDVCGGKMWIFIEVV
jgi:xanthine/CO dehydrogenase XdhC/CoxF family maturation factor